MSQKITKKFLEGRPLSYSTLKEFRKSPRHYMHYLEKPREVTDAMLIGIAFELALLDPDAIETRLLPYQKPNLRTNAGKEEQAKYEEIAESKGLELIPEALMNWCKNLAETCHEHSDARALLEGFKETQTKLTWTDTETGLPLIGYVDMETEAWGENWIVDIKTARSSEPEKWKRDLFNYDYHIQAACYSEGYHKMKYEFPNFAFIVQETSEPLNTSVFFVDNKTMTRAKEELYGSLRAFKDCMKGNHWGMGYDYWNRAKGKYFSTSYPGYYKHPTDLGPEKG